MTSKYQSVLFGRMTIKILRDFILDNNVTDNDAIVINKLDFNDLASDYYETFKVHLPEPYFLVGVLVREEKGAIIKGRIAIIENDIEALREKRENQLDPNRVIYSCGYCGSLVGDRGEELDAEAFNKSESYLKKLGNLTKVEKRHGYCCAAEDYEEQAKYPSYRDSLHDIDYSFMEGKMLMDLTEDDFKRIGIDKTKSPSFEIIYNCRNDHDLKIYFTPNDKSYSLRGFMLREEGIVFTTEDLINTIRNWRKEKVVKPSFHY